MNCSLVWCVSTALVVTAMGGAAASAQSPAPATPASSSATPASIERAEQVLAEARKALGGDKLAGVKTLTATGRTNRVRGNNLVPIEFEIAIELPDKYVRKDEVPAEESDATSLGFVGADLLQLPVPAPPQAREGGPPAPTPAQLEAQRKARATTVKQDFVRWALGVFAASLDAYPVSFSFAAKAAAPQGTADVLDVKGAGNFAVRLFINAETHLPIMVSWQAPPTSVVITRPGQPPAQAVPAGAVVVVGPVPPGAAATEDERAQYAKDIAELRRKAQATPVDYRLYYADYRNVDGVQLPFRLRRAIGADTTEETTFDRWRINTKIDPRKFELGK